MKNGHRLRNEAYHRGIIRDGIILYITQTYFEVLCNILPRFYHGYSILSFEEIKDFELEYKLKDGFKDNKSLKYICNSFLKGNKCPVELLSTKLSEDLSERFQSLVGKINHFSSELFKKQTINDMLKIIQFGIELFKKYEKEIIELDIKGDKKSFKKLWNENFDRFTPDFTIEKIESLIAEARKLKKESYPGNLMQKFYEIDKEIFKLNDIIETFDIEIDKQISQEIDRRLNK